MVAWVTSLMFSSIQINKIYFLVYHKDHLLPTKGSAALILKLLEFVNTADQFIVIEFNNFY